MRRMQRCIVTVGVKLPACNQTSGRMLSAGVNGSSVTVEIFHSFCLLVVNSILQVSSMGVTCMID